MSEATEARQEQDGRVNQRNRTRDAIVHAGAELLRHGKSPAIAEAASAARVSQATAYRYFPTQESLVAAVVGREMKIASVALSGSLVLEGDAEEDLARIAQQISKEIFDREPEHRSLLRLSIDQWFERKREPSREKFLERGGRIAFIVDALEPLRSKLGEAGVLRLAEALSLAIGIEAHLVLTDIWGLARNQSNEIVLWTCRALIHHALADATRGVDPPRPAASARSAVKRSRLRRAAALTEDR